MGEDLVERRWTVAELLALYPQVASVFTKHAMACVGCDLSRFDTLAMVAATYGLSWEAFAAEIAKALSSAQATTSSSTT